MNTNISEELEIAILKLQNNVPEIETPQEGYGFLAQDFSEIDKGVKRMKKDLQTYLENLQDFCEDNSICDICLKNVAIYSREVSNKLLRMAALIKDIRNDV